MRGRCAVVGMPADSHEDALQAGKQLLGIGMSAHEHFCRPWEQGDAKGSQSRRDGVCKAPEGFVSVPRADVGCL